jgi:hypothetical protein
MLAAGIALLAGGCDSGVGHVHYILDATCEVTLDGVTHFVGEPKCFKAFPSKRFSGYWVQGQEYSAFYRDRQSIPTGYDPEAVWLEVSEEAHSQAEAIRHGTSQVLEVSFEGRDPGRNGFFGDGLSKRGIFVDRFLKLEEIDVR